MQSNRLLLVLLASIFALVVATPAAAQNIPPDDPASDQYTEGVPGPGGNNPSPGDGGGGDGSGGGSGDGGSSIPSSTVDQLQSQGGTAAQAASSLGATSPDSKALRQAARDANGNGANGTSGAAAALEGTALDESADGGVIGETLGAVTGDSDGGLGIALPILLGIVLLAAIAVAVTRRRDADKPLAE